MRRLAVRGSLVALGLAIAGTGFVEAAAPRSNEKEHKHKENKNSADVSKNSADSSKGSTSVTELQTEAQLAGAGTQTVAQGCAESTVITVTKSGKTTTNSSLTVGVKGLTLADASVVTFQLNGNTIGTGAVKSGRASLSLSSKKGNTVPTVNTGDTLTVVDPDGTTVDLTGAFGTEQSDTENSGK